MTAVKYAKYRPNLMWIFAFVGGFNKGVGGGGYGPVITVGGLISGVPVKSMVAVTSFAEGMTCVAAVVTWFVLVSVGVIVDYMLLPSFVIGTVLAAVGAPYTTRVIPEVFWKWRCRFTAASWPPTQRIRSGRKLQSDLPVVSRS